MAEVMACRPGCGACCIAPSISTPIPNMPEGKPAGVPCVHLDEQYRCRIFGSPKRPAVCAAFAADRSVCGHSRDDALLHIIELEQLTQ